MTTPSVFRTDEEWAMIRRMRARLQCVNCGRFLSKPSISRGECIACRTKVTDDNRAAFVVLAELGDDWTQYMAAMQSIWEEIRSERRNP